VIARVPLGPFAERDFRNLYLARAFSLLGDAFVPVALAFAVLDVTVSVSALGFVLGARTLSLVSFLLLGGVVADRLPRKAVMIGSDLVRFVAQGTTAAIVVMGSPELWQLIVLSIIYGCGWAFFLPTSTGFVPETVSPGHLQQANALIAATFSGSQIVGPVLAGILVLTVGAGWALALDAGTFLISAVFVSQITPRRSQRSRQAARVLEELREGWREFRSRRWLWADGVYSALTSFVVLPLLFTLGPVVARQSLGGAASWAAIVTALGLGSVLGGTVLMRVRPERPLRFGIPPLMLLALPLLLLSVPASTAVIATGAMAGGFGLTLFNTLFETTVQQQVPSTSLSRVAAIDWMMSQGLQPLGYALIGPLTAIVGQRPLLLFGAIWLVASTLLILSIPDVRNLGSKSAVTGDA
jgi:MFS family permease